MCGIAGYIGRRSIEQSICQQTLALMQNRGPDFRDSKVFHESRGQVLLLHSRLSIIDLDARSNQPFQIGPYILIYNGEIYNYKELRQRLIDNGVSFITESDTEVLLRAYMMYGADCVNHFEGMWAFGIYDEHKKTLFLSRDRFAEKPLYYMETDQGFLFGSEVKFIRALHGQNLNINYSHLKRYLVNGYKSLCKTRETFFEGVREVPPATNVVIDFNLEPEFKQYWKPEYRPRSMTLDEAVEGFRHHFIESIRLRLRADVPLAFCLSGGVDSSAIVSAAAKQFQYDVATFSIIDPDERYNERDNIEATIKDLHCKNTIIDIPQEGFIDRLGDLIEYHDAPLFTASYYIHSFLSQAISEQGYKVVCSGTAADELVTGYYDHFNLYLYEMRHSPHLERYLEEWQKNTGQYVRNPHLKNPKLYFDNPEFRDHIYLNNDEFASYMLDDFKESFTEERYCDSLLRNRMMNEMFHEGTRLILHEDDLNSMKYSVENRSPYVDKNLFEFSYSIPTELLIQKGVGKYILREAVKGILNEKVRLDTRKMGFNASIHSLINLEENQTKEYLLDNSDIFKIVDRQKISELIQRNSLPNSFSKFLFNFINVKMFIEQNTKQNLSKENDRILSTVNK